MCTLADFGSSCDAAGVPLPGGGFVEVRIRKQAQPDNTGRVAVERADRHIHPARAHSYPWILLLVLERIGRTIGAGPAFIEPKAESVRIAGGGLVEARFIDES